MSLVLHAYGAYASYTEPGWRKSDYLMRNLVKAAKGEPFRGYADIKGVDGTPRRVDGANLPASRVAALRTFALWAKQRISAIEDGQVTLVPVPSSEQTTFDMASTPLKMADAVLACAPKLVRVGKWLRFTSAQPKAHQGGSRAVSAILPHLEVADIDASQRIILVDDVVTTGGHMRACAEALRSEGAIVEVAIAIGRTVWDQHATPLDVEPEDLEPDLDWIGF